MGHRRRLPGQLRQGPGKKLTEAAETWARGGQPFDETPLEALRAFGATPEQIEQARRDLKQRFAAVTLEVLPECSYAVDVFFAMATQWHYIAGMAGAAAQGLRYEALPVVLASLRPHADRLPLPQLLPQLRVMEAAARQVLNQQAGG